MRETWVKGRLLDRGHTDKEIAKELDISLEEWLDTRSACSGAPLELKDSLYVPTASLEAKEDDRLSRLEQSITKAWSRMGETSTQSGRQLPLRPSPQASRC